MGLIVKPQGLLTPIPAAVGPIVAEDLSTILNGLIAQANASILAAQIVARRKRPSVVSIRVMLPNSQPAPAALTATYRQRCNAPAGWAISALQLVYTNWNVVPSSATGEQDNANQITVKAAIDISNVVYPVYFNGLRTATIDPGGQVVSDPIAIDLAAGSLFYTRTFVSTAGVYPQSDSPQLSAGGGEGVTQSTDLTNSGSGAVTAIQTPFYGPAAILGTPYFNPALSIAIVGDSTTRGATSNSDNLGNVGIYGRWASNFTSYINLGNDGDRAQWMAVLDARRRRFSFMAACNPTHAILQLGINDAGNGQTDAQMQTNLVAIGNAIADMGVLPIIVTCTPHTSSTDFWATLNNQTVNAGESQRVANNIWKRTVPAPFVACLDAATLAEAAKSNGDLVWRALYTVDGLHAGPTGCSNVAAALPEPVGFFQALQP